MTDDRDLSTLTLEILRDIRDDLRGMREEQRDANARSARSRSVEQRTRVLDIHTDQGDLDPRIERARETNARIEQFIRGDDRKKHDDELRTRVEKLEVHVFGSRTP